MAKLQFMDINNLGLYDELLKNYIDLADAKSLKTVALDGNVLKLYRVSEPVGTESPAYEITLPETDVSGLLAKLTGAVENNVVTVGADGTVKDSGVALADLTTDTELKAVSDLVGVIPSGYTAITIAEYAKELADNVAANGYDDTEIKEDIQNNADAISDLETEVGDLATLKTTEKTSLVGAINELSDGKADKSTTIAGYGIIDAYTKTEVDTAIANAEHLKRSIVDTLPSVDDANVHTIYMVKKITGSGDQQYDEYMLINGVFEKIGDSTVDLTNYTTKTYVDGLNTTMDTRVTALEGLVDEGYEPILEADINALFS